MILDCFENRKTKNKSIDLLSYNLKRNEQPQKYINLIKRKGKFCCVGGFEKFDSSVSTAIASLSVTVLKIYVFTNLCSSTVSVEKSIIAYCSDKRLYILSNNEFSALSSVTYNEAPKTIEYTFSTHSKVAFFYGSSGLHYFDGTTLSVVYNMVSIITACIYNERLFYINAENENKVSYSDFLDITDFTNSIYEGGNFEIQNNIGKLIALVPFNENVYAFGEYGISKLTLEASPKDFVIETMQYDYSKIVANSICVCNDKLVFADENSIFLIKNDKIEINEVSNFSNSSLKVLNTFSSFFNDYYVLSCSIKENNVSKNVALFMSLVDFECGIVDLNCSSVSNIKNTTKRQLLFTIGGDIFDYKNIYSMCGKILNMKYNLENIELDLSAKQKFLKCLSVNLIGEVDIEVSNDWGAKRNYHINNSKKIPIKLRGNNFSIKFASNMKNVFITGVNAEYYNID